jgi:hypothetical protein
MSKPLTNVSFDGSPVQFRLDSPYLLGMDPLGLEMVRELTASLPIGGSENLAILLQRANANFPALSCYQVGDFQPGMYWLDPRDIRKFGDEDDNFDYEGGEEAESDSANLPESFPFVSVDSGSLIFADFVHFARLVDLLTWEKYDLALQGKEVFEEIIEALGGPYFTLIQSGCVPGMEFDGDGSYTIKAGTVRPFRG